MEAAARARASSEAAASNHAQAEARDENDAGAQALEFRIRVLRERGVDVDALPREIVPKLTD